MMEVFFINYQRVFLCMFLHQTDSANPQRIISLVPSITELLFDLDLSTETVGITKFCIHPAKWYQTKEKTGGTKNLNIEKIKSLQPDLIIANKEENTQEQIEILANIFPVYLTDVDNYEEAIKMILNIGEITYKSAEAVTLVTTIQAGFNSIKKPSQQINTAYFIWKDPFMTIGGDTFINDIMNRLSLQNVFGHFERYPQITLQDVVTANPQLILLSSEPYPFKEKHIKEIQAYLPAAKILLADGEMFSWYGSRMKYMPAYFNKLLTEIGTINA